MTDNTQELDEILKLLENSVSVDTSRRMLGVRQSESPKKVHARVKQSIIDWHNKQTLELLDRLEKEINTGRTQTADYVISEAIEAERNKLKERDDE